ncbi:MAG TPA: TIGR02206 family membrane protein [Saprospiraceae bacterium]|nr:TIGR02206 family membrane protein [Saprospiraceae bacterium]
MHEHYLIPSDSATYQWGIIGTLVYIATVIFLGLFFKQRNQLSKFELVLFWIYFIREILYFTYIIIEGKFTVQDSLPLHMCTISYIICLLILYTRKHWMYEFLALLALGGGIQSILTPELTHGYSPYLIIDYYWSHSTIILFPFYILFVWKWIPRKWSFAWIWLIGHLILGIVGLVNYFLHSNYIYLCHAPKVDNALVAAFPNHLLSFEFFGTIHILFFWMIFRIGGKYLFKSDAIG